MISNGFRSIPPIATAVGLTENEFMVAAKSHSFALTPSVAYLVLFVVSRDNAISWLLRHASGPVSQLTVQTNYQLHTLNKSDFSTILADPTLHKPFYRPFITRSASNHTISI